MSNSKRFQRTLQYANLHELLQNEIDGSDVEHATILDVRRSDTAIQSYKNFLQTAMMLHRMPTHYRPEAALMNRVGLKPEGRSSCYDLYYFTKTMNIFAVDCRDDTVMFKIDLS